MQSSKGRPGYHTVTRTSIDPDLLFEELAAAADKLTHGLVGGCRAAGGRSTEESECIQQQPVSLYPHSLPVLHAHVCAFSTPSTPHPKGAAHAMSKEGAHHIEQMRHDGTRVIPVFVISLMQVCWGGGLWGGGTLGG
jgi:hypothetical protein